MAKDKKAAKGAAPEPEEAPAAGTAWECGACGQENEGTDEACCACDEPRPAAPGGEAPLMGIGGEIGSTLDTDHLVRPSLCPLPLHCG